MRLYLIRHGDPDYALDSLTPRGHREAAALAEYLAGEGLSQLFSSPMGRAQATAAYTAARLGLPVTIEPWTRELALRMAALKLCPWDLHGHLIRTRPYLDQPLDYAAIPALADQPLAETMAAIAAGADDFLARLGYVREGAVYRVVRPHRERIALFCHGGLGLSLLAHLLAVPLPLMYAGFFLPTSSVTTILWDEREPGVATPRCLGVGALPHLHAAGLAPSTSGIKANWE